MGENEFIWECSSCGNDNSNELEGGENILECSCCGFELSVIVAPIS